MTRCEFLIYEESKSCVNCTGWFCISKGRKKKVGDTTMCNNEELWRECTRYLQAYPKPEEPLEEIMEITSTEDFDEYTALIDELLEDELDIIYTEIDEEAELAVGLDFHPSIPKPRPPRVNCPYLGPPPTGVTTCCGLYCYAENTPVRTGTTCRSRPSWLECIKRLRAVKRGVPYADS